MHRGYALAAGLLAGVAVDAAVGDPRRGHPVAAFGSWSHTVEQRLYADDRARGVAFALICVGACVGPAAAIERVAGRRAPYAVLVAVATWAVVGAESLRREALQVSRYLEAGDLSAARDQLTHLVGRDTSALDADEIARAAVESVAENTSDAVIAPLVWGAVAGLPGLVGYRAVNTLDAMVGYRSPRYRRFGWAAARIDDAANLAPARLCALLVALTSGAATQVLRVVHRDARRHPSPNAGWCEAAFAGALGIRLGGTNAYGGCVEQRPGLGDGPPAQAADLIRAMALARRVTLVGTGVAALAAVAGRSRR